MAYSYPTKGGLKITYQGQTCGVWIQDTGGVGWVLMVARQDVSGWIAFWSYGPKMDTDIKAEIAAMGGMINWLAQFMAAINAAFQALFGAPPAPGTEVSIDNINLTLTNSFTLTAGPVSPVMAKKT